MIGISINNEIIKEKRLYKSFNDALSRAMNKSFKGVHPMKDEVILLYDNEKDASIAFKLLKKYNAKFVSNRIEVIKDAKGTN